MDWCLFMMGIDIDYLVADIKRRGEPNALSDGSVSHPSYVKSDGAFGAIFKIGYHVKHGVVGYFGGGIERRKFKVQYLIQDQPENSIAQNYNKTAFVGKVGFDYAVNDNFTVGAEYRKAFYNGKTFINNTTTLRFKPETSDTVLLNLRYKLDFFKGKNFF